MNFFHLSNTGLTFFQLKVVYALIKGTVQVLLLSSIPSWQQQFESYIGLLLKQHNLVLSTGFIKWIGHLKEIRNYPKLSTLHCINCYSKLSFNTPHRRSTTVSLETYHPYFSVSLLANVFRAQTLASFESKVLIMKASFYGCSLISLFTMVFSEARQCLGHSHSTWKAPFPPGVRATNTT